MSQGNCKELFVGHGLATRQAVQRPGLALVPVGVGRVDASPRNGSHPAWHSRRQSARRPRGTAPLCPRGREPGQGAFVDQLPLELGQRREDTEHEAAGRRGGVDLRALPGEHPQAHAAGRQVLHGVDQVGEVAAEAVEFPDHAHVARPESAHAAVESRVVVADAGREVVVDVAAVDARGPQGVALQVQ